MGESAGCNAAEVYYEAGCYDGGGAAVNSSGCADVCAVGVKGAE